MDLIGIWGLHTYIGKERLVGAEYAYPRQNTTSSDPANSSNLLSSPLFLPMKGNIGTVPSEWNSGFQVTLVYNIEHDGWETNLCYTRFSNTGSDKVISGCNDSIMPIVGIPNIPNPNLKTSLFLYCTEAKSQTRLHFHTLISDIARDFFISDCLSI